MRYLRILLCPICYGEIESWVEESYDLAIAHAYPNIEPNTKPSEVYIASCSEVSRRQLLVAGYRLAALLNRTLQGDLLP